MSRHVIALGSSIDSCVHLLQAQLGLAHAYSRAKVKFNVNRVDNMIIQAIALLDTLDKDINTFVMRVREWYSWHFPELVKIVNDNYQYSKLALLIKDKQSLTEEKVTPLLCLIWRLSVHVSEGFDYNRRQVLRPIQGVLCHTYVSCLYVVPCVWPHFHKTKRFHFGL